jgi:Mg2+ and Co2+ transporter CorA
MKTLEILATGKTAEKELLRKDLTETFGIHSRDLRPIFTKKQTTSILARGNCLIVSVRSVKMVIGEKKAFVFNLEKKKIPEYFVPHLLEKIEKTKKDKTFFEHTILETALHYLVEKMQRRFEEIERVSDQLMHKLRAEKVHDRTFEQLLHLKKRLSKLETTVEEIEGEITELVSDDDDLKDLYLGTKKPANTDEVESILEGVLEQIEDVSHKIDELDENIDDTQEILALRMSNMRNTIIKFDLLLTAATGVLALLAVITGLYGMNLKNNLEQDSQAFETVGMVLILLFFVGLGILITWLKRKKIL